LLEIAQTLALTLVIFFVIQSLVAQPFEVKQQSMQHTFEPGEFVLVDKLSPRWDTYARGEIVVFEPPPNWATEGTPFIKRVIGVGGDTVDVRDDGRVYVNGTALDEPYTYRDGDDDPEPTIAKKQRWAVPVGELFVMGDHRRQSADSRVFGPIPVSTVIGRALLRYWPISSFGVVQTPSYAGIEAP
jgi:signal peptidase I